MDVKLLASLSGHNLLEFISVFLVFLVHNYIGDEGCYHLMKAEWPKLKLIALSRKKCYLELNKISIDGLKMFHKANWPQCSRVTVRIYFIFKKYGKASN